MRAINHSLTGALIGLIVVKPIVAVPMAVASHFICDALPHYDGLKPGGNKEQWISSKRFTYILYFDVTLCGLLVLSLALRHPLNWQLAAICAFAAASPDFIWFQRYLYAKAKKPWQANLFAKFSSDIQWFQRPIGWVVEISWFIACIVLIYPFLH